MVLLVCHGQKEVFSWARNARYFFSTICVVACVFYATNQPKIIMWLLSWYIWIQSSSESCVSLDSLIAIFAQGGFPLFLFLYGRTTTYTFKRLLIVPHASSILGSSFLVPDCWCLKLVDNKKEIAQASLNISKWICVLKQKSDSYLCREFVSWSLPKPKNQQHTDILPFPKI